MSEWEKQESGNRWKPENKGEELIGVITAQTDTDYGSEYTIKHGDGTISTTPAHKVLLNRMSNAKVGDEVKIVYMGEELPKQKGYKPTKMYEVFIKKN
jgi:hypothetical protein